MKELFRDPKGTEFVIVTIPTVLAISESSRLLASLRAESVPVRRLVVNQLLRRPAGGVEPDLAALRREVEAAASELQAAAPPDRPELLQAAARLSAASAALAGASQVDASFAALKRRDQARALVLVEEEPAGLGSLKRIEAPLFGAFRRGECGCASLTLPLFPAQTWRFGGCQRSPSSARRSGPDAAAHFALGFIHSAPDAVASVEASLSERSARDRRKDR